MDLAELVVTLKTEFSEYTAGLRQATQQIQSFSSDVGSAISDIAKNLAGLYALKEAFTFGEQIVSAAAQFDVLSRSVGISADALSQFAYAAKLQGVDDIAVPLENLARSAGSVAEGNQKAAAAYAALGVSVTDVNGKLKSTDQLFLDVSDAVSKYADGIGKTRVVQEIFGRSGADFIALLDQGSAKIKQAQQEAVDLGVAISTPTAQAARDFEGNMQRIEAAMHGVFNRALEELLPALQALSDQFVAMAKDKEAVQSLVDGVVAGFRGLATAGYAAASALEIVGKTVGELIALMPLLSRATEDVTFFAADPSKALADLKEVASEAKTIVSGANNDIGKFLHDRVDELTTLWHDPTQAEVDAQKALAAASDAANQKLQQLNLTNATVAKGIESAIESLVKMDQKLREQVETYGLSGAAAVAYDLTLGKMAADVETLNKMSPKAATTALQQLADQGKLTSAELQHIQEEMAAGVKVGDAYAKEILDSANALALLKASDALSKSDAEILTLTGHLNDAAKAAYDLANRQIKITLQTAIDEGSGITPDQAQQQVNDAYDQAVKIQGELAEAYARSQAADEAAGKSALEIAGDQASIRQQAIADLNELYVKVQSLAQSGFRPAEQTAKDLQGVIASIQLNPKIIDDLDKLQQYEKDLLALETQRKDLEAAVALQASQFAVERSQGQLSDLSYMVQQDQALDDQIAQLQKLREQYGLLALENPGNGKADEEYQKLGVQINGLIAQTGQLARTVREDLISAATDAFVAFATGSESASKALQQFLTDVEKQLLTLVSKDLFQRLFGSLLGAGSPIGNLLGAGSGATTGATIAASMTGAGEVAALSMQTAIVAGGSIAATSMSTAIAAAGLTGSSSGGLGGLEDIFKFSGITDASFASDADTSAIAVAGLAGGGPVTAGVPYLVGEDGPELMVPDTGGRIVPSGSWQQGGAVNVVNHFHIEAPKGTVSRATQAQIAASVARSMAVANGRNN